MTDTMPRRPFKKGALLAIQLGDIGDVVLTVPALRALKTAFPDRSLLVCVRKKAAELMSLCRHVDTVFAVDSQKRRPIDEIRHQRDFFKILRSTTYALCIDFRTGTRGAILARLCGARRRLGFFATDEPAWRNPLFTDLVRREYQKGTHVADYYFELVKWLGIANRDPEPRLTVPAKVVQAVSVRLQDMGVDNRQPFVALQPFSLWPYKELPADTYVDLVEQIGKRCGRPIVIVGAAAERPRAQAIVKRCRVSTVNMAGQTSIGQLAGLLGLARMFVGVDSAGLHIAAAVGTPTIGVFGPTDPLSWAPRGRRHTVIQPRMPCVPCREKGCYDAGSSRCLEQLGAAEMMETIGPRLDRCVAPRGAAGASAAGIRP